MSVKLETKIRELVAIGASVAANCQAWLVYHYKTACEAGASGEEINEAIEIGETVKSAVGLNMKTFAENLTCRPVPAVGSKDDNAKDISKNQGCGWSD